MELTEIDFFGKMKQYDFTIGGKSMEVYEFEAKERFCSCFYVDITFVGRYDLDLGGYVGEEALFTMLGRREDRYFHGFVSSMTRLEPRGRYDLFRARVVPLFWKLNLISDVRIFQNKTTPEIVREVLEGSGIFSNMYEFRYHGKYSPRECCVQYRETNLAFVSRIMAEEGMFYYFEYSNEKHLLVIGDMHVCHKYIPGRKEVLFSLPGGLIAQEEHVTRFDFSTRLTSGRVRLKDYRFIRPSLSIEAGKRGGLYQDLELYDYPGYLPDNKTGLRLSEVALERAMVERETVVGESICRRFTVGHIFILTDHEVESFNKEYVLTEITHRGKQPQVLRELADPDALNTYENSFKCMSGYATFRPEKPVKPSVNGVQTAFVTGPDGEEIHVDEFGRIKVQFHWDRVGERNESTSCWMRVAQPWADAGWGALFIPRVGQEVVVSFVDGDPDRPVVTGALYNGANYPPYDLPDGKTKSTIRTRSTKGGGGYNELRFDDKKGEEEIFIHGEKDWNIEIKNDKGQQVGNDETLRVGNDRSESIGNNKDIEVAGNHRESVGGNMRVSIGDNLDESTANDKTVDIGGNLKETIVKNVDRRVSGHEIRVVVKELTESVGNNRNADIGKDSITSVSGNTTFSTGKNLSVDVDETVIARVGNDISISSTGSDITLRTAGASITIAANGDITITGANIHVNGSGSINLSGSSINQN